MLPLTHALVQRKQHQQHQKQQQHLNYTVGLRMRHALASTQTYFEMFQVSLRFQLQPWL